MEILQSIADERLGLNQNKQSSILINPKSITHKVVYFLKDFTEQIQKIELKYSILDGTFLGDNFQESLKPSSFISDVQSIANRSKKISFKELQNYPSDKNKSIECAENINLDMQNKRVELTTDYREYKKFQNGLNSKRNEIEMSFKKVRARMRMSLSTFSRDREKLKTIVEKSSNFKTSG